MEGVTNLQGGGKLSKGALILFAIVQVVAFKFVLQHLQNSGLLEVPSWVPGIDRGNCGHYKPREYIVTSRRVITPEGTFPAASKLPSSTMGRSETVQALALQISESWTAHTLNASRRQHIIGFGAAGYALMHNPLAETLSTKIDRHLRSLAVLQSMSRMAGFGR